MSTTVLAELISASLAETKQRVSSGRITLVCAAWHPDHSAATFGDETSKPNLFELESLSRNLATRQACGVLVSPTIGARRIVEALLLDATVDKALRACDYGRWQGYRLAEIARNEPLAFETWIADPCSAPHGGEAIRAVRDRVAAWLERLASHHGAWIAFTHQEVLRTAVLHVLGAPLCAYRIVDVAPLATVELTWHRGRFHLRL